jgi:hypothetical protein
MSHASSSQHRTFCSAYEGWIRLSADLSRYAGWQWSLFYRPERHDWRIILAAVREIGTPAQAFWAVPGIDTDEESARRFTVRHGITR